MRAQQKSSVWKNLTALFEAPCRFAAQASPRTRFRRKIPANQPTFAAFEASLSGTIQALAWPLPSAKVARIFYFEGD
jgi:hypothetical protein